MTIIKRYHVDQPSSATPRSTPTSHTGVTPADLARRLRLAHGQVKFRTDPVGGHSSLVAPNCNISNDISKHAAGLKAAAPAGTTILPGLESIGCGYDVFGMEADSSSLKRPLLDPSKIALTNTITIGTTQYNHYAITTAHSQASRFNRSVTSGMRLSLYADSLSARAGLSGGFRGFSAQVALDVSQTTQSDWYSAFTNVYDTLAIWDIMLNDIGDLRPYIYAEAIEAIDTWTPSRLFDEYGAYFLAGAMIGGRVNFFSITDMFSFNQSTSVEATAKASYLDLIGASSNFATTSMVSEFSQYSQSTLTTIGGNGALGATALNDANSYTAFLQSITPSTAGFIDFTPVTTKRPLRPIWDLAAGTSRKNELRDAFFNTYAPAVRSDYTVTGGPRAITLIMTTMTSDVKDAGTDSRITFKLTGVDHLCQPTESVIFKHDDGRDNHERNHLEPISYLGVPDIGTPTTLHVNHDGSGDKPGWCVDYFRVEIPAKGISYICRPTPQWFDGGGWRSFQLIRE